MKKSLERLIQKYDAATVFVTVATVVVIVELSLMRLLVPSPSTAAAQEVDVLMECRKQPTLLMRNVHCNYSDAYDTTTHSFQTDRLNG